MTPDELPADMEAVVARLDRAVNELGGRLHRLFLTGTPDASLSFDDLRDLLKAYQEQRRALESIAATPLLNDGGAMRRLGQMVTEAQAALNQKGDER
jgi:hypothetical protein